jgi:hypothetical protein
MALKILQTGTSLPIGQYDCLDADLSTIRGGEVVKLRSLSLATADLAAADAFDGYTNASGTAKRTVVTKTLTSGSRPLFLSDDGITGYGTLFGSIVGGTSGTQSVPGTALGPSSATGSGKITLWSTPGLYAVTLDAVDQNATTGLQPTHPTLDTGAALFATAAGLLTPTSGSAFENVAVGRFVEFSTNGSLVTTPNRLVSTLNSPSSFGVAARQFSWAVFYWNPPVS